MTYDYLDCGCGWQVLRGLDCTFCGETAIALEARAAVVAEVMELVAV